MSKPIDWPRTPAVVKIQRGTRSPAVVDPLDRALGAEVLSVYKEKKPRICLLCRGIESLPINKRVYFFGAHSGLSKHLKQKLESGLKKTELPRPQLLQLPARVTTAVQYSWGHSYERPLTAIRTSWKTLSNQLHNRMMDISSCPHRSSPNSPSIALQRHPH